ncbi:LysR family transcriptional regulator [Sulfuriflexus mobilis]|uniref:LysR family transcriptional regulator n=1 Tax=Sulfuriflexus mobilis TaxID=1811807 RepID=UPI000F81D5BD|nr:LysR family transcriptional regulator [Sulfuriflexus mobilis]
MDRFEEMLTFVRVVEAGSMSAAADRLNIAKSAVSRRLAELEGRLGVQLLIRTTRRLNLTGNGQQFYQRCLAILADLEETEQAISCEQVLLRGTIRIAIPLTFGIKHLSPLLNQFLKEHPELSLDLDLNDRTLNFMEEDIDLAIRIGRLADSTLIARQLATTQRIVCASPDYLSQHGEPKTPEELENHVGLNYSYLAETQIWQFLQQDKTRVLAHVPCRMRANNGDILLKAAIDGLGILVTTTFISSEAIEQGLLCPILTDYTFPEEVIYAIYPQQRFLPRRVRALIDYLAEKFDNDPYWNHAVNKSNQIFS